MLQSSLECSSEVVGSVIKNPRSCLPHRYYVDTQRGDGLAHCEWLSQLLSQMGQRRMAAVAALWKANETSNSTCS